MLLMSSSLSSTLFVFLFVWISVNNFHWSSCPSNHWVTASDMDGSSATTYNTNNKEEVEDSTSSTCSAEPLSTTKTTATTKQMTSCHLYYDLSTVAKDSGLGLFTVRDLPAKVKVGSPDVVIHVVDPTQRKDLLGLNLFLYNYAWDAHITGGQYEGNRYVAAALPGVGMSANGHHLAGNVLPLRPVVDEADLPRTEAAAAGAFTHYHNMSFYTSRNVTAGDELVIPYGDEWFEERQYNIHTSSNSVSTTKNYTVEHLRNHGLCADNLRSDKSTIPDAGRGAFATRFIPKGSLIAPLPLLPLTKESLQINKIPTIKGSVQQQQQSSKYQLLINYCFGHESSPILLFPFSSGVNLINHQDDMERVNSVLQWSNHTFHQKTWLTKSPQELLAQPNTGLMLELIATRDIQKGEEVFMNYGPEWSEAWEKHVQLWKSIDNAEHYSPSYIMNDVVDKLRTQEEETKFHPYPNNLQTACFYIYDNTTMNDNNDNTNSITMIKWRPTPGIQEFRYLRPCTILKREEHPTTQTSRYTVQMWNRATTPPDQRIPQHNNRRPHIVEQVPRAAIRFVDKPYTTDQHLPNAFRHWIGLQSSLFPDAWMMTASSSCSDETTK